MKIFKINGSIVEPEISGTEKKFTYIGTDFFATLDDVTLPESNVDLDEISWLDNREIRDEILNHMMKHHVIDQLSATELVVHETLKSPTNSEAVEIYIANVKAEAGRRILEVADAVTRENMGVAYSLGFMTNKQSEAYKVAVKWTFSTQDAAREIITSGEQDYQNDNLWPKLPSKVKALAEEF